MKKNTWTNKQINQYSTETDQRNIKTHKHIHKTYKRNIKNNIPTSPDTSG